MMFYDKRTSGKTTSLPATPNDPYTPLDKASDPFYAVKVMLEPYLLGAFRRSGGGDSELKHSAGFASHKGDAKFMVILGVSVPDS